MKEAHLAELKKLTNPEAIKAKLFELLNHSDPQYRMTYEEFVEIYSNKTTLKITREIISTIAFAYAYDESKSLPQDYQYSFEIFLYLTSLQDEWGICGYYMCGLYYFEGKGCNLDHDKAYTFLTKFFSFDLADDFKDYARFEYGVLLLKNEKFKEAKEILLQVSSENSNKKQANELVEVIPYQHTPDVKAQHYLYKLGCYFTTYARDIKKDLERKRLWRNQALGCFFKIIDSRFITQTYDEIKIIYREMLDELYPKVTDIALSKPLKKLNLNAGEANSRVSEALPLSKDGWVKNLDEGLLDAYDSTELLQRVKELEKAVEAFDEYQKTLKKIEYQHKVAKEQGYNIAEILQIESAKKQHEMARIQLLGKKDTALKEIDEIQFAATRRELRRQYYAQRRFFNPKRCKKLQTKSIATELLRDRLTPGATLKSQNLAGVPTRRLVTAERSALEVSKQVIALPKKENRNELGWMKSKEEREKIMLGNTSITYYHQKNLLPNHLGNFWMDTGKGDGTYNEIIRILHSLTGSTNDKPNVKHEKEIASLMLEYAKTGNPVTLAQLQSIKKEVSDEELDQINRIFYLVFVKEIARRMCTKEDTYDLPIALLQARAVRLITAGHLTLNDVFRFDAPYGVVTGENVYNNHNFDILVKMRRVNRLYNEKILQVKHDKTINAYRQTHPKGTVIASHQLLHRELKETYGGDSDTDNESDGYHSDDEKFCQINYGF